MALIDKEGRYNSCSQTKRSSRSLALYSAWRSSYGFAQSGAGGAGLVFVLSRRVHAPVRAQRKRSGSYTCEDKIIVEIRNFFGPVVINVV